LALFFQLPFRSTQNAALSTSKLALIGFVFSQPKSLLFLYNPLSNKSLRRFNHRQIGFVFSNVPYVAASSILSFIGMGMAWAGSAFQANWLCLALFFVTKNHRKSSKPP